MVNEQSTALGNGIGTATSRNTLTVTDNRTGKTFEIPITDGTIKAMDFRQMRTDPEDFGLMTYDPGLTNTASCRSAITFIDGDRGILEHRGYPIEQLCAESTYLEVAYLLIHGELPTESQLAAWIEQITFHTYVHENIKGMFDSFRYDAHPMGMLCSTVASLSTFYPESKAITDPRQRHITAVRLLAKVPTLVSFAYRHSQGLPFVYPSNDLSYASNFLNMMFSMPGSKYAPDPRIVRALDVLFILHADHEQNCSTNAVRAVGSSEPDPFSAMAGGVAALYGPLHGGANEEVLQMLEKIGTADEIPGFIDAVKDRKALLMGFGHRVYKNYDPRAKIIKRYVDDVLAITGTENPKLKIAVELEQMALNDEYFIGRKLFPNVDFYSGILYEALNIPTNMFTTMFALARTAGWVAQWLEGTADEEQKIVRPRQIYTGFRNRDYVPVAARG